MGQPVFPLKGACLCGAVQITVTEAPLLTFACHCRDCQKLTASAYSLSAMIPSTGFSYTGAVVKGGLGSEARAHYFCKSCLNFIFSQIKGLDHRINLRISLLEDANAFPPFIEVMADEKLPWADVDAVHSYAQRPASLDELQGLIEAYPTVRGEG